MPGYAVLHKLSTKNKILIIIIIIIIIIPIYAIGNYVLKHTWNSLFRIVIIRHQNWENCRNLSSSSGMCSLDLASNPNSISVSGTSYKRKSENPLITIQFWRLFNFRCTTCFGLTRPSSGIISIYINVLINFTYNTKCVGKTEISFLYWNVWSLKSWYGFFIIEFLSRHIYDTVCTSQHVL